MRPLTVGIAGTAKNTGKTTATRALLDHYQNRGINLGITSIGYDGERLDNITGLPKPRIFLKKGDFAAVSEHCLSPSSAGVKVLERMDISTPLGKIICGRVMREGLLVVAGPNQSRHLRVILRWMCRQEAGLVMVDGALNRIAPMVETDGFILSTGASRTIDIDRLALETHSIGVICNRPELMEVPGPALAREKTVLWNQKGEILAELSPCLFDPETFLSVSGLFSEAAGLYCPGVISSQCLQALAGFPFAPGGRYLFEDPVKLLLSGDVVTAHRFIEQVAHRGSQVGYRRALPLLAVTVNPFYPCCRYGTHDYQPAYIDRKRLLSGIKASVDVPVFDVVREGPEELAGVLEVFAMKKNILQRGKDSE